jgi:riboflavin kinase/FMN adenylyltransferase
MRVIQAAAVEELGWDIPKPILGMGTMDGVHLGHQEILRRVRQRAVDVGGTAAVLTFVQHPLEVVRPDQAPTLMTPLSLKLALLSQFGVSAVVAVRFSAALADLEAEEFVRTILVGRLGIAGLCVGYDFGFGRDRKGDVELLRGESRRYGFWLEVVAPVSVDGVVVSSRGIRSLLAAGKVEEARHFLGRPYCLEGPVQPGTGRGRDLGFPTANVAIPETLLVRDGVYAGRILVRGRFLDCLMNLGRAPTFGGGVRRLEVHIPGWEAPLYGQPVAVFFLTRLRDEQAFSGAQALAAQLARDREAAAAAWEAARGLPWPEWTLHS